MEILMKKINNKNSKISNKNTKKVTKDSKIKKVTNTPKNSKNNNFKDSKNFKKGLLKNSEKAFILLAKQENISLNKAKKLIDDGLVSVKNARLEIAREMLPKNTRFAVIESSFSVVYEDSEMLVLDKGIGVESYCLERRFSPYKLINRLDKDTSGIILLAKNEETRAKAIKEFKERRVKKIYLALITGKLFEEIVIKNRISTRKGTKAKSFIESKNSINHNNLAKNIIESKEAISIITPLRLINGNTLVEISIPTGATHQIRVHLSSKNHPIIGDIIYNNKNCDTKKAKRLMLHCHKTTIFNKEFTSKVDIDKEFNL